MPPTATAADDRPASAAPASVLEIEGATVAFEGLVALDAVDLRVGHGEILGLIGPNGAGKSTLLNAISGFTEIDAGRVSIDGRELTGMPAHRRARLGIGRSFQAARVFLGLTVRENVEAAALAGGARRRDAFGRAATLLERAGLAGRADALTATLPAGLQSLLGILRALATEPRFLLLDEPAAGLDDSESKELVEWIRTINRDFGCGIVVIDHDMRVIMPLCQRIHVLNEGRTICIGSPDAVRADPAVLAAYLGSDEGGEQHGGDE